MLINGKQVKNTKSDETKKTELLTATIRAVNIGCLEGEGDM